MTEAEFIAAVEETGATDVWVLSRQFDAGSSIGVGVSFSRHGDGRLQRNAVRMPAGTPIEDAYPALLDWAKNPH